MYSVTLAHVHKCIPKRDTYIHRYIDISRCLAKALGNYGILIRVMSMPGHYTLYVVQVDGQDNMNVITIHSCLNLKGPV